jgi:Ca2+-transporting ATPase
MSEPPRLLDESLPNPVDLAMIAFLGMVMVIGTAMIFWFSGGGIITGQPCTEYDGSIESDWFDDEGNCREDAWREDAENRFEQAQTRAFAVFILFQLFNVINCRSVDRSIFQLGLFNNKAITISFAISAAFLLFMVQGASMTIPFIGIPMGDLLSVVSLEPIDWAILFATASSVFLIDELRKLIMRSRGDNHQR